MIYLATLACYTVLDALYVREASSYESDVVHMECEEDWSGILPIQGSGQTLKALRKVKQDLYI